MLERCNCVFPVRVGHDAYRPAQLLEEAHCVLARGWFLPIRFQAGDRATGINRYAKAFACTAKGRGLQLHEWAESRALT